jgi:hypothetical protein
MDFSAGGHESLGFRFRLRYSAFLSVALNSLRIRSTTVITGSRSRSRRRQCQVQVREPAARG